ncbi:hypothetical protein [Nostoc sp.]
MQKNPDCLIIEGIFLGDPQKTGADKSKSGDGTRMRSHAQKFC